MSEESQVPIQESVKKERTPAQIDALNRARLKAQEVRAQNKQLRDKQKEIDKATMEEVKRAKVEKIEKEYSALSREKQQPKEQPPDPPTEEVEEVVYQKKEKKPKKKRIVVVQASSDSEDSEIEVRLPKKKKKDYLKKILN